MERNIPDVRDIFGRSQNQKSKQELRCYEYSPRSRRRQEPIESCDIRQQVAESRSNNSSKKSGRNRSAAAEIHVDHAKSKRGDENQKNNPAKNKDSSFYSNKTLTERDIRHLERHLSMKKTIRKQISRNLAQAFVDDPELILKEATNPVPNQTKNGNKVTPDRSFTLTRAKVSKSEQNVLDLLKDNEPDSGHCSTDNPNSSDDDCQDFKQQRRPTKKDKLNDNNKDVPEARLAKDESKFSFWKMFSVKNKGKR